MKMIVPVISCWLLVCLAPTPAAALDSTLIDFAIKDQFDEIHRNGDYHGRLLIVFAYDRKGNDYQDLWFSALRDSLPAPDDSSGISCVRLANVRGVPFFLKSMLKGKFPKEPDQWVLLDWKGRFDKAYEFADDRCTILIFNQQGRLIRRTAVTELTADTLASLLADIRSLLPAR